MKYQYILFDLDGTLTDPKQGITKAVAYALKKMKGLEVNPNELTKFIGPPLKESFTDYYCLTEDESNKAIEYFREYFSDIGIYENEIYCGIKELLEKLKANGKEVFVATSKPTIFANVIIKYFGLQDYFTYVVGSHLDGSRTKKSAVIEAVLNQISIKNKEEMVMIGDRKYDILGAKEVNIDSIGVEYGYGTIEELEEAGANHIAHTVENLSKLLLE